MGVFVSGCLTLALGCVTDPQTGQTTSSEGVKTIRQTREAAKEDVRTITTGTRERVQTEKDAAKQAVTGTHEAVKQTGQEIKTEGEAIKQDTKEMKQMIQDMTK